MHKKLILCLAGALSLLLTGCDASPVVELPSDTGYNTSTTTVEENEVPLVPSAARDCTPVCLECKADGTLTDGNEFVVIDYSNYKEGYIMVKYTGSCETVKLLLTGPDEVTYTYDLKGNAFYSFPLSASDGNYVINVCENIVDSRYSIVFGGTLKLDGIDEFGPYLYPSQYVNFDADRKTVRKGAELAANARDDIGVVTNIYDYIIGNITYDYEKADTVAGGYISDIDEILESGTGICLDYAAVMTAMLRTQSIPTRLEVGYVGKEMLYHAWISVYIEEVGWLNGIIQFNGHEWSLVDPTLGAAYSDRKLKSYVGDGSNYSVKFIY